MKLTIDTNENTLKQEQNGKEHIFPLNSKEAFELVSQQWINISWSQKYAYSFTWLGRPIIQLPEDMVRMQEVIFRVQPDVIIETGVAHGGSLIFYASLCKAMDKGRIVGVDVQIRPHNREAIEGHFLHSYITLIEGSSIETQVVEQLKEQIKPGEKVLVILDSCHTKEHVLAELAAYSPLVTKDSYIVATDGIMGQVVGAPRTQSDWTWNNPKEAALAFVEENPNFVIEEPVFPFNEGSISERVTYWPSAYIRKVH